jgi:hypothetical protein
MYPNIDDLVQSASLTFFLEQRLKKVPAANEVVLHLSRRENLQLYYQLLTYAFSSILALHFDRHGRRAWNGQSDTILQSNMVSRRHLQRRDESDKEVSGARKLQTSTENNMAQGCFRPSL